MNTHHDILEAARKGEVGKAANCGYYGARPQTILSLISRGLLPSLVQFGAEKSPHD